MWSPWASNLVRMWVGPQIANGYTSRRENTGQTFFFFLFTTTWIHISGINLTRQMECFTNPPCAFHGKSDLKIPENAAAWWGGMRRHPATHRLRETEFQHSGLSFTSRRLRHLCSETKKRSCYWWSACTWWDTCRQRQSPHHVGRHFETREQTWGETHIAVQSGRKTHRY